MQVTCIKCDKQGSLSKNQYKAHDHTYKYYGIKHYDAETKKHRWCYLGKYTSLPDQYKSIMHKNQRLYTNDTQTNKIQEKLNSSVFYENNCKNLVARR